jgi:hypothetical protein
MAAESERPAGRAQPDDDVELIAGEPRWPILVAVGSFIALTIAIRLTVPHRESVGPHWLVPALEIALLVALMVANQAQENRRAAWARPAAIGLIVTTACMAILSDCVLIVQLVQGSAAVQSASSLLASGAMLWIGTALVFGLLYWELDSGGPFARHLGKRPYPDFAFTQQVNPDLAPPGWRPHYVDYFALGFTTSTAFSPTDVMPQAPWAKLSMALQSLISLTVLGLVIARAVNVFT